MATKILTVIFNPASAGGKTRKKLSLIKSLLNRYFDNNYELSITSKPLDATTFTREALNEGHRTIVAVGGDGTIQEVVNGFFDRGILINKQAKLGIINCGTGCGLAQSLNLPQELEKQFETVKNNNSQRIDIGKVLFRNGGSSYSSRYFINELQLGIGGSVVSAVQSNYKKMGGFLSFGLTTLAIILKQPNYKMSISIDNYNPIQRAFLGIMIANGAYTGGGMNLAPHARLNDHRLDILLMYAQTVPQRLKTFPKIYHGRHIKSPQFGYYHGRHISIDCEEDVLLEADGELLGHPPCDIEIINSCIEVLTNSKISQPSVESTFYFKKEGSCHEKISC